ncbi:MAG: hypothetical protein Q4Q03_02795 [Bowdeniella nasicola]|nr:hypothetical protein [Bowdeniella nasicola]
MATSPTVARLLPAILRMCDRPGALLLRLATFALTLFTLMAALVWYHSDTLTRYLPALFALAGWICVGTFSYFRAGIRRSLDSHPPQTITGTELQTSDPTSTSSDLATGLHADITAIGEAYRETQIITTRFFPRINATQRALVHAAGGVVNAPYLRYDLRLVLASFVGTNLTVALATFGSIVCALALLL